MKARLVFLCLFLACPLDVQADTICRVKSTGQIAEAFSSTQADGHCVEDLTSSGIVKEDIEQLTVSPSDRLTLLQSWRVNPNNPDKVKRDAQQLSKQQIENATKQKLGLSDQDFQNLKESLK